VTVKVVGAEPNGLATMLAELLEANLRREPRRRVLLRSGTVELEAEDAEVGVLVRFRPDAVTVSNADGRSAAAVRVRASSTDLLALSAIPLRFGLPDPLDRDGRAMLGAIARRRVRISGLWTHPILISRLARLLSVR
jgi:hypothetical protein